ncbi:MAG: antibiotic biosynthesis monooxygenase [Gammaproteobacteria bacterium]|nr:MAG: antibiotic biosynthesis monooxygenase [Gammaproteobacteria bacterium]
MAVHVLLESKIKSGQADQAIAFIQQNLDNVRSFDGCSQVKVLFDEPKQTMLFDEIWNSPDHHQRYIESISKSGVMATLVGFLEAPPTVSYLYPSAL